MATLLALFALLLVPQDRVREIRDYAAGETSTAPDMTGLDWKQVQAALAEREFPEPAARGEEQSCTHALADGSSATFFCYVPATYDPKKLTTLVVFLHGAVGVPVPGRGKDQWKVWKEEADANGWIACSPSATDKCLWWNESGEEHIFEAVRYLSARFNIDRNRVVASGFSDGASGVYALGMRFTDQFAGCIAWNGALGVITARKLGNSPYYSINCKGTSWRTVHGEKDGLYPSWKQKPKIDQLKEAGVNVDWKSFAGIGHEGPKILKGDREYVDRWLEDKRRNPLPKEVDWIANDVKHYGQSFWVRIVELGDRPSAAFAAEKDYTFPVGDNTGTPADAGRIRATREGNTVQVLCKNVAAFDICVSPEAFDLSKKIAVTVNGEEMFSGLAKPDAAVLVNEVRRRHGDAAVPYVARISVTVPAKPAP